MSTFWCDFNISENDFFFILEKYLKYFFSLETFEFWWIFNSLRINLEINYADEVNGYKMTANEQ